MTQKIQFDDARARVYRKRVEVLAFRSDDPICFHKQWGKQELRNDCWVIVPQSDDGKATSDIYGCDADAFAATYEPSPSLRPNQYRKKETIRAYQPGSAFEVDTVLSDGHVEVKASRAGSDDTWIVRAPGGEVYPIENAEFRRTYVEVLNRTDA
jgi:hypothetical protein